LVNQVKARYARERKERRAQRASLLCKNIGNQEVEVIDLSSEGENSNAHDGDENYEPVTNGEDEFYNHHVHSPGK